MKRYLPAVVTFSLIIFLGAALSWANGGEKTLRCWRCGKSFAVSASQQGRVICPDCGAPCLIKKPTPIPTPSPVPSPTPIPGQEPASISWKEGAKHVGQTRSVKGMIVGTHLSSGSGNLYLNFDPDYTTYISIKIPKEALGKFPSGAAGHYQGKTVVATGEIVRDKKYVRLIVTDPSNLFVVE
ncbi:MAG: hypothetical protein V1789_02065 [PVC group bacterium]